MIEITAEYLASQGLSKTTPERFWEKVEKTESCWIWTGSTRVSGHGQLNRGKHTGKPIGAHVVSWILHRGPIPEGLCVLHNCPNGDNPSCVNPDHLWLGTQSQNNKDMDKKGVRRHGHLYGEHNPLHKLTWEIVDAARKEFSEGKASIRGLARRFGVTQNAMHCCIRLKSWKHQ